MSILSGEWLRHFALVLGLLHAGYMAYEHCLRPAVFCRCSRKISRYRHWHQRGQCRHALADLSHS